MAAIVGGVGAGILLLGAMLLIVVKVRDRRLQHETEEHATRAATRQGENTANFVRKASSMRHGPPGLGPPGPDPSRSGGGGGGNGRNAKKTAAVHPV